MLMTSADSAERELQAMAKQQRLEVALGTTTRNPEIWTCMAQRIRMARTGLNSALGGHSPRVV